MMDCITCKKLEAHLLENGEEYSEVDGHLIFASTGFGHAIEESGLVDDEGNFRGCDCLHFLRRKGKRYDGSSEYLGWLINRRGAVEHTKQKLSQDKRGKV